MSKERHLKHQGERSPVVVRDVRRIDPIILQSRRRQDVSGPDGVGQGARTPAGPIALRPHRCVSRSRS
ncbi:hypothetical protein [Streptomyces sp. NPDC005125]